ncbi:serine hydrolase domain-containing protein [Neolewinella persica]|uniref:serine hydrolase domain-containing protein n=1 Tax=Neolewinella persica TaxID=70998 RepID=UPI000378C64A|nr:serine hydrolase domain-containing protein [Neolewinella persica]
MIIRLFGCAAFLLCLSTICLAQPSEDEIEATVDAQFSRYNDSTPGFTVGILKKGRMIFKKGYGTADLEHGTPVDPDKTVFNLASVSKQFTVLAILLLEKDGKLSLEDDVHKYLPTFPDYGKRITLHHLAANASGIRADLEMMGMAGYTNDDLITQEMVLEMIFRQQELNFSPGEEFLYSNSNFVLLAEIVEKVAKIPFSTFLKQRIFDPLGMANTFVMDDYHRLVPRRAYAYGYRNGSYQNDFIQTNIVGATGVYTTLTDFAKWALNFEKNKVGSAASFQKMSTPYVLNNGTDSPYGLGLFVNEYKGLRQIHHAGGTGSYRAIISSYPDQDLTVLLMSNDGSAYIAGETAKIADMFLQGDFPPTAPVQVPTTAVDVSNAALNAVTGAYFNDKEYYVRNINLRNDSLFYTRPEQNNRESYLRPIGNQRFILAETTPTLYVDFEGGKMEVCTGKDDKSAFSRIILPSYSSAKLKAIEGNYFSEELQATYVLKLVDGRLMVHHPRMAPFALQPISTDGFLSESWRFNYLNLERGDDGGIQGFRTSSTRVRGIRFERL